MERAGYRLVVDNGGTLRVSPAERLNEAQRDWLRRNKLELLATVRALADPNVQQLLALFDAEVVRVHTINTVVCDEDGDKPPPPPPHTPVLTGLPS
jgi:hypothetical protein